MQPTPSSFNDGFSHYETLAKLIYVTNTCISAINNIIDVGLTEPINNKLNEMADNGELGAIIKEVIVFDGGTF
jgi:hypothetical protein